MAESLDEAAISGHTASSAFGPEAKSGSGEGPGNPDSKRQSGVWDRLEPMRKTSTRSSETEGSEGAGSDVERQWAEELWPKSSSGDSEDEQSVSKHSKNKNRIETHHALFEVLGGRLYLAPIKPKAVLDVGTGPGLWPLEMAQKFPDCTAVGIDKDPIKAPYSLPNCRFRVMDALDDWTFNTKFDLIHWRMLGDILDKRKLVQKCFDNLSAGGWLEMTEWIVYLHSPNHSLEGTAFKKWNLLFIQGLRNLGGDLYDPSEFQAMFKEAGFKDIRVTLNGGLTNPCYPGNQLQKIGRMMTQNWLAILEPFSMPVFVTGLGWPPAKVHSLLRDVRQEIGDTRYHSYMTLLTVYGRKKGDSTGSSASESLASGPEIGRASTSSAKNEAAKGGAGVGGAEKSTGAV